MTIFEDTSELIESGRRAAMLTVVDTEGSVPREVGTRMVVTPDEEYGTIGGGTVEHLAIESARDVLAGEAAPGVRTYELEPGGNTGMVCGGEMSVFVDRIGGQPRLYIAGAGHIGAELAPMAQRMGYDVTVVDDREEYASPDSFPDTVTVRHGAYEAVLRDVPMTEDTAVAVATRSGTFDQAAIAAALDGGAGWIGLVASDRKADRVLGSLADEGYEWRDLAEVRSPVGLSLGGGGPEDVALSILSEIHLDQHEASGDRETSLPLDKLVVVRGGGDLGSGVVYRLHQAGYPVVVTEMAEPMVVRRAVAFGSAIDEEVVEIEGVVGRRASDIDEAVTILREDEVPVLEDPEAEIADVLGAAVVVDAIMAKGKTDTGTTRDDADVVVGLGPGFEAGADVDAVVETDRGHELGRVFYEGTAREYDGEPAQREGYTHDRVFRAPTAGRWDPAVDIGDLVEAGETMGHVDGEPVQTEIDGLVRGLVHDGRTVEADTKLGDVDPRGASVDPKQISDKALSLGGGVLEAVIKLR